MGDTMSWLAGQVASLIPNVLPATTAAASSSFGGCVPTSSTVISLFCNNTQVCPTNSAQVQEWATLVSNCGQVRQAPTATGCCSVCC